jgi:predicted metalloendopeptidase
VIGAFGLDLSAGNPQVRPGDDFFAHASGTWYNSFEIPADRTSFGAFTQLDELSRERVREIIAAAAAAHGPPDSPEQKIGDYYTSFLDEAQIDARGLAPIAATLARIAAARSHAQIAALFGLRGHASLFDLDLPPDLRNPDRYAVLISQGSLGLPDRDYYLKGDPQLRELRSRYTAYVIQMLTLTGFGDADAHAHAIVRFETRAARQHWPIGSRRDVEATYNPRDRRQLRAEAPGFDWSAFLQSAQLGARQDFIISEPSAISGLCRLFARTPVSTLRAYLTFRSVSDHAAYLPRRFDEARFEFYGRALRGQPRQRERWKRGVDEVNAGLGEQVGQLYVARHFPPASRARMQGLVANLRAALGERIDGLEWMTRETRDRARRKLASFTPKIGYPDVWKDYAGLRVRAGDPLGNAQRAVAWKWERRVARLDQPVDRDEWHMTPQQVNAYYNPLNNEIVFPAAILQAPFFDPNADEAVNYGAIGAVIGHEIGHGFDDQGRKFGPDGRLCDWWTERDAEAFNRRATQLVSQYSRYEALPGLRVNGTNTLGENIGDLGGLSMAYHAYRLSLAEHAAPVIDGLTGDQRFFLAWAQIWRAKYRDEQMRELVLSDVHSPPMFRVNGPLPHMGAWYAAFEVQSQDRLFIRPENRISIW